MLIDAVRNLWIKLSKCSILQHQYMETKRKYRTMPYHDDPKSIVTQVFNLQFQVYDRTMENVSPSQRLEFL